MRKVSSVIPILAALSFIVLLGNGSCKNPRTTDEAQASATDTYTLEPEIQLATAAPPDPENTRRFTLVYTNNVNAEYEACG